MLYGKTENPANVLVGRLYRERGDPHHNGIYIDGVTNGCEAMRYVLNERALVRLSLAGEDGCSYFSCLADSFASASCTVLIFSKKLRILISSSTDGAFVLMLDNTLVPLVISFISLYRIISCIYFHSGYYCSFEKFSRNRENNMLAISSSD